MLFFYACLVILLTYRFLYVVWTDGLVYSDDGRSSFVFSKKRGLHFKKYRKTWFFPFNGTIVEVIDCKNNRWIPFRFSVVIRYELEKDNSDGRILFLGSIKGKEKEELSLSVNKNEKYLKFLEDDPDYNLETAENIIKRAVEEWLFKNGFLENSIEVKIEFVD